MQTTPEGDTYFFAHRLAAPPDRAYDAHLEPRTLERWWGGGTPLTVLDADVAERGQLVYRLEPPDGRPLHGRLEFEALTPPERIVYRSTLTTEGGLPIRPRGVPRWPLHLRTTVVLVPDGDDATVVSIRTVPAGGSRHDAQGFREARDQLSAGLRAAYRQLDRLLAEPQGARSGD